MVAKDPFSTPFAIKEELEIDYDDGSTCFPISGSGSPESELNGPSNGLNEPGPPAFLRKTFLMVDDPESDPIVSWSGGSGCSFVVWDPHGFAAMLLPKYFKHRNFSSFVRQLNTYGFRKVHLDRWEFANAGFRRGKKHLLKTIKRRNQGQNINSNHNNNKRLLAQESEILRLKEEQDMLRLEILGLKNQQQDTQKHVVSMEERVTLTEWNQQQMVLLIAKLMAQSSFIQLLSKYKPKKRRVLLNCDSNESSSSLNGMRPVHRSIREDILEMQSEMNCNLTAESNYILWEKLMEDDVICESGCDVSVDNQLKFVHELEDLIEKQT